MNCQNCQQKLTENDQFCSHCGQKVIKERLTIRQLLTDLLQIITNLERGLLFTVKEMALRPFKVIDEFISGRTQPYYGPLRFVVLWVTISVVVNISLGLYDQQQETISGFIIPEGEQDVMARQQDISNFFKKYANVIPLLIIPFTSLISSWLMKKRKLNYAEHLVMNAYIAGFTSILGVLYLLFFWLMSIPVFQGLMFTTLINYAYYCWAYKKLFGYRLLPTMARTALILFFGFVSFSLFSGIMGTLITIFLLP